MDNTVASGQIRIDADVSGAIGQLKKVSDNLTSLIPGGEAVQNVLERIEFGAIQVVQGLTRNAIQGVAESINDFVDAGTNMAKTIESSAIAFETLLGSAEEAQKLINDIQKNAVTTPFDVDALTLSTQKMALITKNGAQAEQTVLDLGKALAAAGRGTTELNRMATNLQQIGTNAYVSARDIREFGNAGIAIVDLVYEYSEAFKKTGKDRSEVMTWLQSISDPYIVITNALHAAATGTGEFAEIYERGMTTMKQVTENFNDAIGIFSYRVMDQAKVLDVAKSSIQQFTDLLTDMEFAATAAAAIKQLVDVVKELNVVEPIIEGIRKVVSAFASGQFNNVIVFFKNFFNALKQFSGIRIIANGFKVLFDLFSNNHTSEEVAKVAQQLGNVVRALLEFKLAMNLGNYVANLATTLYQLGNAFQTLGSSVLQAIPRLLAGTYPLDTLAKFSKTALIAVGVLIAGISAMSSSSIGDFFKNIVSGVQNAVEALGNFAKDFFSIGWNLIAGLWNGIVEALNNVFGKIGEVGSKIVGAFQKALGIRSPSTRMRDEVGQYIDLGIAEGIRRYYGTIVDATDDVMTELVKLQADYVKEMGDFGALDLVQQVNVYKEFAALYARGTKARLEMDAKVHDAETAIVKEIIDLVEEFNKQFEKAYKTAKEYYDMFEYTQTTLTRTTKSVIEGLRRQNTNMEQYYENLAKIASMGFDSDFLTYLYDQGMDAASEVAGLADATREQIDEINNMWATRGELATKIAILNTKELKDQTLEQIDYLQTGLETKAVDVYDTGTLLAYNFTRGIYDMLPSIEDALENTAAKSGKALKELAASGEEAFDAILEDVNDVAAKLEEMEIEAFDTKDIFSLLKNVLAGIPWQAWAVGAGILFAKVSAGVAEFKQMDLIKKNLANLPQLLGNVGAGAQGIGDAIGQTAKRTYGEVSKAVKDSFAERAYIQKVWENDTIKSQNFAHRKTINTLKNITDTITNVFKNIREIIGSAVKEAVGTAFDIVRGILQEILQLVREVFSNILREVTNVVRRALKFVTDLASEIMKSLRTLVKDVLKLITDLATDILKAASKLTKSFAKILSDTLPSIKSILNSLTQIITTFTNKVVTIVNNLVKGVMKIAKTFGKGLGEALKAMLAPLSDPELLIGAGAIAIIATAILELSFAAQQFSQVSPEAVLTMTIFTAVLGGLTYAVSLLAPVAMQAMAGAAAMAVVGAALMTAALLLGVASQAVDSINYNNLALLELCLGVAGVIMGLLGNFAEFVAIGAIVTAAIGAGLAVAALCLGVASQAVDSINYENLAILELCVGVAGAIMGVLGNFSYFIGLGAIATAAIGAGLAVAAICLGVASEAVNSINYENLILLELCIGIAGAIMGVIGGFAKFVAIGAVVTAAIGLGLTVAATCLATASESATRISIDSLWSLEVALGVAAVILGIIGAFGKFVAIGGLVSAVISGGLLISAVALSETCLHTDGIDIDKLWHLEQAISVAAVIMGVIGTFGVFAAIGGLASTIISGGLLVSAIALEETCKHTDGIDIDKLWNLEQAIAILDIIMAAAILPALLGAPAAAATLAIAVSVAEIVESIKRTVETLNALDGIIANGETVKDKMTEAINLVIQIAEFKGDDDKSLTTEGEGWFAAAYDGLKGGVENLAKVATEVEHIISSIYNIVETLNEIDKAVKKGENVQQKMTEAINLVIQIAEFKGDDDKTLSLENDGPFKAAYDKMKGATENLAAVTENVSKIINGVADIVKTLKEVDRITSDKAKITEYITRTIDIVIQIAEFKGTDDKALDTDSDWFSTAYDKQKGAVENLKSIAENISAIVGSVKNIVDILSAFDKEKITQEKVQGYITNANTILQQFAGIEVTQEGLDKTSEAVKNVGTIAENVAKVLENAKKIVDNMENFVGENAENFNHIIDESSDGYISKINAMLAALGKLSAANETENAYKNLAQNLTDISSAVTTVTTILENAKKMVDAVDEYLKATDNGKKIEEKVKRINEMLVAIAGDGSTDHPGIQMPSGTQFDETTKNQIGYVKEAIDSIKGIAETIDSVPDVANKLTGVEAIVTFINETMSQIPEAISGYAEDFKGIGESCAAKFQEGMESKYSDITAAAEGLQNQMWSAIEAKMQDEWYQGEALAGKVVEGILSKAPEFKTAGEKLQDELWKALEGKMQDEWFQGQALSQKIVSGFYDLQSSWWQAGDDVAAGFAGGIERNIWRVNQAAGYLSQAAIQRLKLLLDIHSPSRVMAELGGYVTEGFAEGIEDGLSEVESAGEKLAEAVMSGYDSAIEPLDLTAFEARGVSDQEGLAFGYGAGGRNITINQSNNIYDNMDMAKALNELSWSVSRA